MVSARQVLRDRCRCASGLAASKSVCRARTPGHQIVEKSGDLGGVWDPARSYPDVQTQSPKDLYRYTDRAMPDSYPEWPKGPQVHAYLADYARESRARSPDALRHRRGGDGPPGRRQARLDAGARNPANGKTSRGFRFRRDLHRTVQRAADTEPSRRRRLQGARRTDPALVELQRSLARQGAQGGGARRLEIGDRYRRQRRRTPAPARSPSSTASRCGASPTSSAASSTSSASSTSAPRNRCLQAGASARWRGSRI